LVHYFFLLIHTSGGLDTCTPWHCPPGQVCVLVQVYAFREERSGLLDHQGIYDYSYLWRNLLMIAWLTKFRINVTRNNINAIAKRLV